MAVTILKLMAKILGVLVFYLIAREVLYFAGGGTIGGLGGTPQPGGTKLELIAQISLSAICLVTILIIIRRNWKSIHKKGHKV